VGEHGEGGVPVPGVVAAGSCEIPGDLLWEIATEFRQHEARFKDLTSWTKQPQWNHGDSVGAAVGSRSRRKNCGVKQIRSQFATQPKQVTHI
jgi:hypothetical protein